jgi:hypothetical protein
LFGDINLFIKNPIHQIGNSHKNNKKGPAKITRYVPDRRLLNEIFSPPYSSRRNIAARMTPM